MADRKRFHKLQIDKLDKRIEDLEHQLEQARKLQGIHFMHLQKGT